MAKFSFDNTENVVCDIYVNFINGPETKFKSVDWDSIRVEDGMLCFFIGDAVTKIGNNYLIPITSVNYYRATYYEKENAK